MNNRDKAQRINFTKTALERLQPAKARRVLHDDEHPGLCLHVEPSGSRAFYVYRKVNGRPMRIRVGGFPALTVENARKEARQIIAAIETGEDPVAERRAKRAEMTIGELWDIYLANHANQHKKASSVAGDKRIWEAHLKKWKSRPLSTIKRADVKALHHRIGKDAPYSANRTLALLSKAFSIAIDDEIVLTNPCAGIQRFEEISRDRFLDAAEIKRFITVVTTAPDPDDDEPVTQHMLDLFAALLFTGARRGNVQAMRWEDVNLKTKTWRVRGEETKNGEPLVVHLAEPAMSILKRRRESHDLLKRAGDASRFVFPGRTADQHVTEPKKAWAIVCKKAALKGVRMHDLRRTMGSWQTMTGANMQVVGKTLGHRSQATTAIYARLNLDPVRSAVDTAVTAMMAASLAKDDAPAVLAKIG